MSKWTILIIVFFISCSGTPESTQAKNDQPYPLELSKYGALSVLAIDVSTGDVIIERHSQQRMTPASLTKIFTTGAGIASLPSNYRYKTRFYINKGVDSKTRLVIVGGGDPTLGSNRFNETKPENIFKEVADALLMLEGIHTIDGGIVIDNSCYSGTQLPSKRLWEDVGNYYGATPNALSYKENTFRLSLKSPAGVGKPCTIIKTIPKLNIEFDCRVKSAANRKDSAYIYGTPAMDKWYVSGTIPQGRSNFTIKGALPHPEATFANELRDFLRLEGIQMGSDLEYQSLSQLEGTNRVVYTHHSPSINKVTSVINKRSHNLYADHLLFSLGQETYGKSDWDNGVKALTGFWRSKVPGFSGLFFDGCGLSPFNAVSASDMVEALVWMNQSEHKEVFKKTLSVAGVDGTLRGILKDDGFKGKVIGKSGSMNGVLGYCGYIKTQEGKELAFCIMANRYTESFKELRANMESLMKALIVQN